MVEHKTALFAAISSKEHASRVGLSLEDVHQCLFVIDPDLTVTLGNNQTLTLVKSLEVQLRDASDLRRHLDSVEFLSFDIECLNKVVHRCNNKSLVKLNKANRL